LLRGFAVPEQLLQVNGAGRTARQVATLLRQVWRDRVAVDIEPGLASELAPLLLGSGVGPLVSRSLRATDAGGRWLRALRDAARLSHLHAVARTERVAYVVTTLRSAGIEALLGKGWAVATRFYAEPALRPSSDIDLFVSPKDFPAASGQMRCFPQELGAVDLHRGCDELRDRAWSSMVEKRIELRANGTAVWTFGDEHHLRLLTLHFVKHGGFRTLWLCDVAALVERCGASLNWDEVLRGHKWRSTWVVGVVALARDLLGADVRGTPAEHFRVPSWATEAVLHEWETPFRWPDRRPPVAKVLFAAGLSHAVREVRARWPSPVEAFFNFRGSLDDRPRLPYELLQLIRQSFAVPRQLVRSLANRWSP
jgi:hypothetical protein